MGCQSLIPTALYHLLSASEGAYRNLSTLDDCSSSRFSASKQAASQLTRETLKSGGETKLSLFEKSHSLCLFFPLSKFFQPLSLSHCTKTRKSRKTCNATVALGAIRKQLCGINQRNQFIPLAATHKMKPRKVRALITV